MKISSTVRTFALILATVTSVFAAEPAYRVTNKIPVAGDGGWDYLTADSTARRLYVTHSTKVQILDLDKGTVVGEIADTSGVHGVALAPELHRGFTSNGKDNSMTIFDLQTLKTLSHATVEGENPDTILFEPRTQRVFTCNGRSANISALDPATA